jgi:hypothetical protein
MANPQKRKGDAAEREAAELLSDLLGLTVRRKLGAGRTTSSGGDTGDLDGVPGHAIQVASWANAAAAARIKPAEAVTARKDDAPAADQAAMSNVAGWCSISVGGGLIQTTSG